MAAPTDYSVYTNIRQAAKYGIENYINPSLKGIRYLSSGNEIAYDDAYYYNWVSAFDPPRTYEKILEYPSCNIYVNNDLAFNRDNTQLEQNRAKLSNMCMLNFDCLHDDMNNQSLARDKMLADLQTYFGLNYIIPTSAGAQTCFNCYYDSSVPFLTEENSPRVGITVTFKVWYNITLINPRQIR